MARTEKCALDKTGLAELRTLLDSGAGLSNKQAIQAYEVLAYYRVNCAEYKKLYQRAIRRKSRPAGKVLAVGYYTPGCGDWPEHFLVCKTKHRACGKGCRRVEVRGVPR